MDKLTTKQRKYIKYTSKGIEPDEARTLAGYSPNTKIAHIEKTLEGTIQEHFDKAGLSDKAIADNITELALRSNRPIVVKSGQKIEYTPDNLTRLKALETASKLKGLSQDNANISVDNRKVIINLTPERVDRLEAICNTLKDLNSQIAQGEQTGEISQVTKGDIIDISNKEEAIDIVKVS